MTRKFRHKFRSVEKKFLKLYSAWQETHRVELAAQSMKLFGVLQRLNPHYSVRDLFQQAF